MIHLNIKIFGKVQGVGFRYSARVKAGKLGIAGFVRNELDGSVYIEAEGDERVLKQFLEWCEHGFDFAEVAKIESSAEEVKNFPDFAIK